MYNLTKAKNEWKWTKEEAAAWDKLKQAFTKAPLLITPDLEKPWRMEPDGSGYAIGGVLMQKGDDDKWHPVAFMSKSMTEAERNYDIMDREMLAIIRGLEEWRCYLLGSPHLIEIFSDHLNLTYFRQPQNLNRRQARWLTYFQQFNIVLKHKPGKLMIPADILSRRDGHDKGEHDNEQVTFLPKEVFKIRQITGGIELNTTEPFYKEIQTESKNDPTYVALTTAERTKGRFQKDIHHWIVENGIAWFKGKVFVPDKQDLRRKITKEFHESPVNGHPGRRKTTELIKREFWWPGMTRFINSFVEGCAVCQSTKTITNPVSIPVIPIITEIYKPWESISHNHITDLPESNGYNAIYVVVDHGCSKGAIFIPCKKEIDTIGNAQLYFDNVFRRYGLPKRMISDRGPLFTSKVAKELFKLIGVKQSFSMAYHPQTDGETERVNQELELYLRTFCGLHQHDWEKMDNNGRILS